MSKPDVKLTAEEVDVLRGVLASIAIKARTGEVGIVHGMDRFVSSHSILRKADRIALDAVARKLGLVGVKEYTGSS